jgi:hypothetical protein
MERSRKTDYQDAQPWRRLFEAAMVGPNPDIAPQKIADAQEAIAERALIVLLSGNDRVEQQALADAHLALNDLKRISHGQARFAQQELRRNPDRPVF